MKRAIAAAVALALVQPVWATTWHVCPNAAEYGAEDGTSEAACFDGLADMAGSYASILPNDTVEYHGNFTTADAQGGTTYLHRFADAGDVTGNIILDLSDATINAGGTIQRGMEIQDNNYLTIRGGEIYNATTKGLLLYNAATDATDRISLIVDGVYVHDIENGTLPACIDSRGTNVTIKNSVVDGCGEDAIYHKGANAIITGNTISHPSIDTEAGDCVQLSGNYAGYLIAENHCDHRDSIAKQCYVASVPTDNGNGRMIGNTCLRPQNEGTTTTYGFYAEVVSGVVEIARNWYRGGRTAIQVVGAGTSRIESNVVVVLDRDAPTDARGVSIGGNHGASTVSNNTIFGGYEGILNDSATPATYKNNIVVGPADDCIDKESGDSESYNDLHDCGGDAVANDNVATTTGAGTITSDPQFIGGSNPTTAAGFQLKPTSPLIGAGTYVGKVYDFTGRKMSVPANIGAFGQHMAASRRTATMQ